MSGICGWVGQAVPAVLAAMLGAIEYRGDQADEIAGQPRDAGGIEDGQQCLALRGAADDRAGEQAGEVGAFTDHAAELDEILRDLIERPGIVGQLEKGAGIAHRNA